jgi:hypothetical protein
MPVKPALTYTVDEVITHNFEAICLDAHGRRYLWHRGVGIRVDPQTRATTLISDPALLPNGPWIATALGEQELREGSSSKAEAASK